MTTVRAITAYEVVELTEPIGRVPAGARAGVMELELRHGDEVMLEVIEPELDGLDRIIYAPVSKLRRVA